TPRIIAAVAPAAAMRSESFLAAALSILPASTPPMLLRTSMPATPAGQTSQSMLVSEAAPTRALTIKDSAPAIIKRGCMVAAYWACGHLAAVKYTVKTGPATPARVLAKPPSTPAVSAGVRPVTDGEKFLPKVTTARAISSSAPTIMSSGAVSVAAIRNAAGTEPMTSTEPISQTYLHCTLRRTVTVVAAALAQARMLSTMMPSTGPNKMEMTGPVMRPTPIPETRCMHEP